MNPFDLRGPEFLLFYILFGAVVLTVLNITRREREDDSVSASISDPYLIAYLRGGERAVVEAAAVALIDRGLMEAVDDEIRAKSIASANRLEEVEKRLLEFCAASTRRTPSPLIPRSSRLVRSIVCTWNNGDFCRTAALKSRRAADFGIAVLLLGAVAGTKIMVALSRGHSNIGFLVTLAFVFCLRRLPHQQPSPHQKRRSPADRFDHTVRRPAISRKHVDARHGRQRSCSGDRRVRSLHASEGIFSVRTSLESQKCGRIRRRRWRWVRFRFVLRLVLRRRRGGGCGGCGS